MKEPDMTDPVIPLSALVARWRDLSAQWRESSDDARWVIYALCADELEAAVAALPAAPSQATPRDEEEPFSEGFWAGRVSDREVPTGDERERAYLAYRAGERWNRADGNRIPLQDRELTLPGAASPSTAQGKKNDQGLLGSTDTGESGDSRHVETPALSFDAFSAINRQRCESPDGFNHRLDSWSTSDWFTAVMGELGESANIAKKLNRVRDGVTGNKETVAVLRDRLRQELGDTFVYLDLLAQSLGFQIGAAAVEVFNAKSDEIGCSIRVLPAASPSTAGGLEPEAAALAEIRRHLSPDNENVKRGDLVAAIRDLAQAALSEKGNAEELERQLRAAASPSTAGGLEPERWRMSSTGLEPNPDGEWVRYER